MGIDVSIEQLNRKSAMNNITFEGRIRDIKPVESGISAISGKEWKSQDFIMEEIEGQYPQSIALRGKGEQVLTALGKLSPNDFDRDPNAIFRAYLNFNAHTYPKKDCSGFVTITDITCWKLENVEGGAR